MTSRLMSPELQGTDALRRYRADYERGWRTGQVGINLDRADADGRTKLTGWMDGYLDAAAGRAKWHYLKCPDHDRCGQG